MDMKTFFENPDILSAYLYTKTESLSQVKLQKSLYFLYAYYSAMYGKVPEGFRETEYDLPEELFPAEFEAWNYGPVIREIHQKYVTGQLMVLAKEIDFESLFEGISQSEVKRFIDDLFSEIVKVSDFALVDRSHADKAWSDAFIQGIGSIIPNQAIIEEYQAKFAKLTSSPC